jgi:hypothetical protein
MTKTTTTAKCKRCGRTLTDPKSVAAKLGRVCAKKHAAAQRASVVIAAHKPATVDKAIELIGDAGVLPVSAGLFLVAASDGSKAYETTSTSCTCTAGVYGRTCYHRVAVELVLAAA